MVPSLGFARVEWLLVRLWNFPEKSGADVIVDLCTPNGTSCWVQTCGARDVSVRRHVNNHDGVFQRLGEPNKSVVNLDFVREKLSNIHRQKRRQSLRRRQDAFSW